MMRGLLILLTGSIGLLVASLLVRLFLLPDIVPVAWAEQPQPLWAVEAAFLLHATEFVAIGTTLIAVLGIIQLRAHRGGTSVV